MVAKGGDFVAFQIRKIANAHAVPLVEAPLLTRAIFHTTDLDHDIPEGLYTAVAQVLAYIFQLNDYQRGLCEKPVYSNHVELPQAFIEAAERAGVSS